MNNQRRSELNKIAEKIADLMTDLETLGDEEQEAFDNLPESFQDGDRGDAMQAAIDYIEQAKGSLEEANSSIEEAVI